MREDDLRKDVVIVGGGPAGLNAALVLGRCGRDVLICDNGQYRNRFAKQMHGFLTRDGISPDELRAIAREQLMPYPSVTYEQIDIFSAEVSKDGFLLHAAHKQIETKFLLLCTGIQDRWPEIEGANELYGTSIFHCPYCDGWELKNMPLGILAKGDERAAEFALELLTWSSDIAILSDGPCNISNEQRKALESYNIAVYEKRILRLIGENGVLKKVVFEDNEQLARRALFFNTFSPQKSPLAEQLGCKIDEHGSVVVGHNESTNIPGLFVAGDASKYTPQAIIAAAEGFRAAVAINNSLQARLLAH